MTIGNHVDRDSAADLTTPLDHHRAARRAAPLTSSHRLTGVPWQDVVARRALLADLAAVVAAVALGYVLRFDREVQVDLVEPRGGQYVLISVALAEAWVVALGLAGARSPRILGSGRCGGPCARGLSPGGAGQAGRAVACRTSSSVADAASVTATTPSTPPM